MHTSIETMLKKYQLNTIDEKKNALKEIIQEIALLGLYRSGFFSHAAFYGGTALRIFYGLDRFSEDLDFSLMQPDMDFQLDKYTKFIQSELSSFGFEMEVQEKIKSSDNNIKSAFIKGGTEIHLLKISPSTDLIKGVHKNEQLRIKLEVDTNPPGGASFEVQYHLNPIPFSVQLYSESSLFASKIHALLCRKWKTRVKGRDFYDFVWFLSKNSKLDLQHLEYRMKQSGHLDQDITMTLPLLKKKLQDRLREVDFTQAKQDVLPFINDSRSLELWSKDFFISISEKVKIK